MDQNQATFSWEFIQQASYPVGIFVVSLIVLFFIRKIVWNRLRTWADKTSVSWDNILLQDIHLPISTLLVIVSLSLGLQAAPDWVRKHTLANFGPKVIVIAVAFWILDRALSVFVRHGTWLSRLTETTKTLLLTVARILVISLSVLVILDTLGVSITPILASLGVGSIAIALALQDTLGNFFAGLYILVDKPIRVGDFVKIDDGIEGTVRKIGWRSSQVELPAGNMIFLPNSKVASSILTNYNLPNLEATVAVAVGVAYDSDLDRVERISIDVAQEVQRTNPGGVAEFVPIVRYTAFGDSSINFVVIMRAKTIGDTHILKHEFIKRLHVRYQTERIEIPFPHRTVHLFTANPS